MARRVGVTLAMLAALMGPGLAASAGADELTVAPPAALSFSGSLQQSNHSVSVRVRCAHSVLCAGHVVLRLIGQTGTYAGKTVDTESRLVRLDPGRSRVAVLRYSSRAQNLLFSGHNLTVRVTLKPA